MEKSYLEKSKKKSSQRLTCSVACEAQDIKTRSCHMLGTCSKTCATSSVLKCGLSCIYKRKRHKGYKGIISGNPWTTKKLEIITVMKLGGRDYCYILGQYWIYLIYKLKKSMNI